MANLIVDVKPSGTASAYVNAPFDVAKETLESAGYSVISLQRNAQLRMQQGTTADISINGNYTREGVIYVPGKGIFLTKNSPIMANAKEATQCHRNGKEYLLTPEQVEQSLQGAVKLSSDDIPVNRFKDNEITAYAFGEDAKKYGDFLKEAGINSIPIWLASLGDKAFARQMWLLRLAGASRSALVGYDRNLDGNLRVRGVQDGAEGTQLKKSDSKAKLPYTERQLEKTAKIIQGVREGRLPASKLEKSLAFLELLRE